MRGEVAAAGPALGGIPLSLIALAVASFGIGTTEFVIMGLLPDVARDLHVSIPRAGLLVTGYALGVVVGAPIVAIATMRLPRKPALLAMIGCFVAGNLLCAIAPNYGVLMAARVVTAFCHAAFFGIGSVVAADLVPPNRRASAIALVFGGLTVANMLGVPLGTALGQAEGWRAAFWGVVAIGVVSAGAVAVWLPAHLPMKTARLRGELRILRKPQVLLAMLMSVLSSASFFALFTYIAPLLEDVSGIAPRGVTGVLLLFGAGITLGNLVGGRLADWRLLPSMIGAFGATVVVFVVLAFACNHTLTMVPMVFVWGIASFALVPLLQLRVVDTAAEAPNLPSTLNQGAFNLGNATGAWIGGVAITAGVAYSALPWVAAAIATAGCATCLASIALQQRSDNATLRAVG